LGREFSFTLIPAFSRRGEGAQYFPLLGERVRVRGQQWSLFELTSFPLLGERVRVRGQQWSLFELTYSPLLGEGV